MSTTQRRPIPIAARINEDPPLVRDTALEYLRDKIDHGQAGLDPYDPSIFILDAGANEIVWAYRMLHQLGLVLVNSVRGGGRRYTTVLEADVRMTLGLDEPDAPTMADVALASRGVDAAINAPTLVLTGTEDNVVDHRNADVVAARIPGARVERLPGTGHLFFWEQPDACVRIISEFLQ